MAVLLGVLMGFGRMSGDQEMTAARACGVSLYRLAIPVMIVAMVVYAVSSYFAFSLRPWSNSNLREQALELSQTRTSAGLKEKIFNSNFPGLVVYVDEMSDTDSSLKGVMISDARDPHKQNTIIAKRGALVPDEKQKPSRCACSTDRSSGSSRRQRDPRHQLQDLRLERQSRHGARRHRRGARRNDLRGAARGRSWRRAPPASPTTRPRPRWRASLPSRSRRCCSRCSASRLGSSRRAAATRSASGVSVALFFLYYSLMRVGETLAQRGRAQLVDRDEHPRPGVHGAGVLVLLSRRFRQAPTRAAAPATSSGIWSSATSAAGRPHETATAPVAGDGSLYRGPVLRPVHGLPGGVHGGLPAGRHVRSIRRSDPLRRAGFVGSRVLRTQAAADHLASSAGRVPGRRAARLRAAESIGRSARVPATRHQPARDGGAGAAGRGIDLGLRFSHQRNGGARRNAPGEVHLRGRAQEALAQGGVRQQAHLGARARRVHLGRQLGQEAGAADGNHALPARWHFRAEGNGARGQCAMGRSRLGPRSG